MERGVGKGGPGGDQPVEGPPPAPRLRSGRLEGASWGLDIGGAFFTELSGQEEAEEEEGFGGVQWPVLGAWERSMPGRKNGAVIRV